MSVLSPDCKSMQNGIGGSWLVSCRLLVWNVYRNSMQNGFGGSWAVPCRFQHWILIENTCKFPWGLLTASYECPTLIIIRNHSKIAMKDQFSSKRLPGNRLRPEDAQRRIVLRVSSKCSVLPDMFCTSISFMSPTCTGRTMDHTPKCGWY